MLRNRKIVTDVSSNVVLAEGTPSRAMDGPTPVDAEPGGEPLNPQLPPVVVLGAAFAVSLIDSRSYPVFNVIILILGNFGPGVPSPTYLFLLPAFAGVLVAIGVFYLLGRAVDFARQWRLFVALSFAGALAANLVWYLAVTANGAAYTESGFGFVQSAGLPEPSGILDVLTGATGTFIFPVAGLAIAYFRRTGAEGNGAGAAATRISLRPFVVAGFVIAAAALPLSSAVNQFLTHPEPSVTIMGGGLYNLVPAYVEFLVYPVLLIATFYLLGRKSTQSEIDLRRFGAAVFAAGASGILVGLLLNLYQTYASGYPVFTISNLADILLAAAIDGVLFLLVGIASVTPGIIRGPFSQTGNGASWAKRGYAPVLLAVLVVAVVATAAIATSYATLGPPAYSCSYQPGNVLYLRVVTDHGQNAVSGLGVKGQLLSSCPIAFSCSGSGPCGFLAEQEVVTTLGEWNFTTNSTGYVTVPSSMLGGSDFRITLSYLGHSYMTQYQICGGGTTMGQLSLPSGVTHGQEYPSKVGSSVTFGENGTQVIQGCNPVQFSGNATVS
jgi:hypothetical protein